MSIRLFLRLASLTMPARRGEWLRAMLHELPNIPPGECRDFALGCFRVALIERITLMTAAPPLRIVPGLFGAALLTVLCVANGMTYLASAPVVGGFLLLAAILWLAVLMAVQSQEPRCLASLAIIGAFFYAAIGALALARVPAFVSNGELLKILSIEGLILLGAAYGIAHIRYFWSARFDQNVPRRSDRDQ